METQKIILISITVVLLLTSIFLAVELASFATQRNELSAKLAAKTSELNTANADLSATKKRADVLLFFLTMSQNPPKTGAEALQNFQVLMSKVQAIGDPDLTAKFQESIKNAETTKSSQDMVSIIADLVQGMVK